MINRALLLCISIFYFTTAFSQGYVTLFEDCNYHGRSGYLTPGNYRSEEMKIGNDRLSCLQVPNGMKVTLYEHNNFTGSSITFTNNVSCLPDDWQDRTSSVTVETNLRPGENPNDYVTFYNDCYNRGYSRSLNAGTYTGYDLGTLKQNISSFAIYGNLRVRAYMTSDNATGYYVNFDENQSCLAGSYNDKIQSLIIEYRHGGGGGWDNNNNNNNGWGNNNNNSNNYATVYTDCQFQGNSLRLLAGSYQGDKLGLLRYDISSIRLPSGLRARVYLNSEYLSGNYYTIDETNNCLPSNMNNRIGSLVIEEKGYGNNNNNNNNYNPPGGDERVTIYTDENYRGLSVSLLPGTYYSMSQINFPDKSLSSLTVPDGYRVVIYDRTNFGGRSYTITQSKPKFFLSGWNDKTSSIAVYRDR
jgi:hypothetical protein